MKQFLKVLLGFSILSILLLSAFQGILSFRMKGKSLYGHDNLEQTANRNADLVFLGSSRCWAHFSPRFFDSAFALKSVNIGVDGHSELVMAIIRLKDYLSRNQAPRWAILNVDPFISAGNPNKTSNFVHKNTFARYAFLPSTKDQSIVNYFNFDWKEKYVPLYAIFKYKVFPDVISLKQDNDWSRYGFEMHQEDWDTVSKPVTPIMRDFFFKPSDIDSITNTLSELKLLCTAHNIKLLCIQTPVYKVIYDDASFQQLNSICENLHIPFVDANKAYIRNDIKYFYNSNHLNKRGIDAMNALLKSDSLLMTFFSTPRAGN